MTYNQNIKKTLCIVVILAMTLGLCACISPGGPTAPTVALSTDPKPTVPISTEPISTEPVSVLEKVRQQMEGTAAVFAVAYLGYLYDPCEGNLEQFLKELCPELLEAYPFMAQIPAERILGGEIGEMYLVVPRYETASISLGRIDEIWGSDPPETEIVYQSDRGDPFLLIVNGGFLYPDHQVTITAPEGKKVIWYPFRDEMGYINLPYEADVALALDLWDLAGMERDPYWLWLQNGWSMPFEESLYATGWYFVDETGEVSVLYNLDLLPDGNARFYACYDGGTEYLEVYEGIWYCHVEGDYLYLNLSLERNGGILYQPDEVPVTIMDTFPLLMHFSETSLLLGKGLYECQLPFATDGEITAVFEASVG